MSTHDFKQVITRFFRPRTPAIDDRAHGGNRPRRRRHGASPGYRIEPLENRLLLTALVFQPSSGSFTAGAALPQAYGDRVTATSQGGYKYANTGGFTPNVLAAYGTNGNTVVTQGAGYGTLPAVITTAGRQPFEMTLTADPGYNVTLSFLDLGAYNFHDWTIKSMTILDGTTNKVLYSVTNQNIRGNKGGTYPYSHFIFATPLQAQELVIRYDDSNLTTAGANVGIGGVTFGQVQVVSKGTISGTVFNDANGDGIKQSTESALANWRVFLDTNGDGVYQSTETSVLTNSSGAYSFSVAPGTYKIAEVVQSGYWQLSPTTETSVVIAPAGTATVNFGNVVLTPSPAVNLIFQPSTGSFTKGAALPQAYGDRVTAQVQNGYKYGTTTGSTPNVVADYGTNGNTVVTQGTGYGTLPSVITTVGRQPFEMTLTADPGYLVSLNDLDLGAYNFHDWVIKSMTVLDGTTNKVLFSVTNQNIRGNKGGTYPYSHFIFTPALTAQKLIIRYDDSNLTTAGADVGLGGVNFSQDKLPTPAIPKGLVVAVPNLSVVHNSTATLKINVTDSNAAAADDIEGMDFALQISGGTGTTPSIQSVDLLTGTIWAGTNAVVDAPAGGQLAQFKAYSVITGGAGQFVSANGLLATIVINTTNATAGTYTLKLIGTEFPGFDSSFFNGAGNAVTAVFGQATLTVT